MLYIKVLIKTVNLKGLKYCVLLMMLASSSCVFAQKKMADDHKLDSLTFSDRISLRTNGVDWMMLLANFGVEFDLGKYNWSRNAIGLNVRGNWNTKHTYNPGVVYNLFEVRGEFRNYWHTRKTTNDLGPHRHTYEKILSGRRRRPKHPRTTWYRGGYLAYDDYSFLFGKEGIQGQAYTLGFQYGVIRPLYIFPSGKSVDLDFGFSAGFALTNYEKYSHDSQTASYYVTEEKSGLKIVPFPILTEARVGLVYRVGKANIYTKYRWRYDVDLKYQEKVLAELDYRAELRKRDMEYLKIYRFYQNKYDSLLIINMRNHESIIDQKLADTRDMKRKADKAREEQARKIQEQAREKQREERIKAQEQKAKEDSIALVDKANARKVEEQVRQQIEADKLKAAEERKLEKALDAEEKALLKQKSAEEKAMEKQMAEENRKYEEEKRKRMNEAYAEQRKYDAQQKALQKERDAQEAAKEKERIAKQKEWERTLEKQEKEAKKKRAEQLKKQSQMLNSDDDDYDNNDDNDDVDEDDADAKAEAAKADRDAKKKAQEEAKARAKAEKEAAKEAARAEKEAKKKAEAEAKAAAKAAKENK